MPNERGKMKVREKTLKRVRKGMSEKDGMKETCEQVWQLERECMWNNEGRGGNGKKRKSGRKH